MATPRQRRVSKYFGSILRVWKRRAANPRLAIFGSNIAVSVKGRLPAIAKCRFQLIMRVEAINIGCLRHDIEYTTQLFYLQILYWIEQVFDHIDIIRRDGASIRNLAAGIGVE